MSGDPDITCADELSLTPATDFDPTDKTVNKASIAAAAYADTKSNLVFSFNACADPTSGNAAFHGARQVNGDEFLQRAFTPAPTATPNAQSTPAPSPVSCTKGQAAAAAAPAASPPHVVPEDRFIVMLVNSVNHLWMELGVNPLHACFVSGQVVLDSEVASCTASGTPLGTVKCTSETAPNVFCGDVSVPFALVKKALGLGSTDGIEVATIFSDKPSLPSGDPPLLAVEQRDGDLQNKDGKYNWRGWETLSQLDQKKTANSGPSPSPNTNASNNLAFSGALILPVNDQARFSMGAQSLDSSFIDKRYRDLVNAFGDEVNPSSLGTLEQKGYNYGAASPKPSASPAALPAAWTADQFDQLDVDPFQKVILEPVRYGETLPFADRTTSLQPLNFKAIPKYNYGLKIVSILDYSRYGAAYYRNFYDGELRSGTALHVELVRHQESLTNPASTPGVLNRNTILVDAGATYVVANRGSASYSDDSNKYNTQLHTANLAMESSVGFGDRFRYKAFFHDAFVVNGNGAANGNDRMLILSSGSPGAGDIYADDGSTLRFHASAGYRSVDSQYDPLGTTYDEFTGTRTMFASGGFNWNSVAFQAQPSAEISLARSIDPRPEYSLVDVTSTVPFTNKNSIDVTYQRSNIAALMYSKEAGDYFLQNKPGALEMLRNDLWKGDISWDDKHDTWDVSIKSGLSWTTIPSTCPMKVALAPCQTSYARKINGDFKTTWNALLVSFSAEPASKQNGGPSGTSSGSATNQIHYSGLLNYCVPIGTAVHFQPRFAYDSNISDGVSSYIPGTLVEPGVDILAAHSPQFGLRLGWKVVHDAKWLNVPQKYGGIEVKLITANTGNSGSADSCTQKKSTTQ